MVDSDLRMESALLADYRELVYRGTIRPEVEGWRNALVELGRVFMLTRPDLRC